MYLRGFVLWKEASQLDFASSLDQSRLKFKEAAGAFFEDSGGKGSGRALLEFSTLMDAYATVQEARILKNDLKFDDSLVLFSRATEILRATVHFGFMAGYVSGCASLETAREMNENEEKFQGFKNSIALFEQAKLALGFRDEHHPLIRSIDALIKFAISRAFLVEARMLRDKGSLSDSRKKTEQFREVEADFEKLAGAENGKQILRFKIDYFLKSYECERASTGPLVIVFPEQTSLWIGNVGINEAKIQTIGNDSAKRVIPSSGSISWPMSPEYRGKLRIRYNDKTTKREFDEGCLTVI